MTNTFIDPLKTIKVNHDNGELLLRLINTLQIRFNCLLKKAPIGKSCQIIQTLHLVKLRSGLFLCAHVMNRSHQAGLTI